jgi:L-ascorbate metabolism protein UlaG (beta-lactamase superfamily)
MLGGPFMDYKGGRVQEIKDLLDKTKRTRANLVAFHSAMVALDKLLSSASGFSMNTLYPAVPHELRGYVELVYDLRDQPSVRILESLLYKSEYYMTEAQSIHFSIIAGDDRPFLLSTPRLPAEGDIHIDVPFKHSGIDLLFSARRTCRTKSELADALPLPQEAQSRFLTFLTSDPPPPYRAYDGNGVRWRYFGHACILIETSSIAILLDPCLSYTYETTISRYTYLDLPEKIDYVLITHNHQDHLLFETVLQLRHTVRNIVVPKSGGSGLQDISMRRLLHELGFDNVIELDELQEIHTAAGSIIGLPFFGEHCDLNIQTKLAYLVTLGTHRLLFAADSCNIEPELYQHLRRLIGTVDVLFLGMECDGAPMSWIYGPLRAAPLERKKDQTRRFAGSNYQQGIDLVNTMGCGHVYVYAMGQEPWLNYVMSLKYTEDSRPIKESNRLIEECRSRGIVAERLFGEKEILLS